jgi:hypothetical protein
MKLGELLENVREIYVTRLAAAIAASPGATPEPVLVREDGQVAREGLLSLGLRADLARPSGATHETVSVDSTKLARFEPLRFEWNGVPIELRPFFWDALMMTLVGVPTVGSFDALRDWYEHWFQTEAHPADAGGLGHVVHFMSEPSPTHDGCDFDVDLGSAPVEAFEELLDAATSLAPIRVVLGARQPAR